jgi:hypothetical protein
VDDQLLDPDVRLPAAGRRFRLTAPMSVLRQIADTRALIDCSRNDALADFNGLGRSGR